LGGITVCCKAYQNQPTKPLPLQAFTPKQHLLCDEASSALRQCLGGRLDLSRTTQEVRLHLLRSSHFLIYLPLPLHAGRIAFHCCGAHLSKVGTGRVLSEILQLLDVSADREYSLFWFNSVFCLLLLRKAWQSWEGEVNLAIPAFLLLTGYCHGALLFCRGWSLFWGQTRVDVSLGLYGIALSTGYSAHLLSLEWSTVQAMSIPCRRNLD